MSQLEHERGFTGTIRNAIADSASSWDKQPTATGPNIVVIVLDDVGYSQLGCYGSSIDTPALDRLADNGLRYANFHVTPLCSPTRACLLTGRNHHAVGMSRVTEMGNGFPNTAGFVAREAGTLAEMLKPSGYRTMCVGKWHLVLSAMQSPAGPYDHWPLQRGFDRFYGFLFGETSQWNPELFLGNERIDAPPQGESGDDFHLSEAIVDRAMLWLRQLVSADDEAPFFLYVAFGAAHSPHHVPAPFIDKYRGRFDDGWDVERDRILARQRASGLLPSDQQLAPRNPDVQPWHELDDNEQQVYARMQEVFAGFLDHADVQIGRLLEELERLGKLDDTLIIALSDNGASAEGGASGALDHTRPRHGIRDTAEEIIPHLDELGGPAVLNHYPRGWAMAGNTPFKRYKRHTHSGGVRAPLLISWPNGIEAQAETRRQFCHVVDLAPTILDLLGIEAPDSINGIEQMPIHGVSLSSTLSDPDAPSPKTTQYFEMIGNRAIWHEGWKAVTFHEPGADYDAEPWELYHLDEDIAELNDLANAEPERLARMIDLWWQEAERYGVLPLDDHSGGHQLRLLRPVRDAGSSIREPCCPTSIAADPSCWAAPTGSKRASSATTLPSRGRSSPTAVATAASPCTSATIASATRPTPSAGAVASSPTPQSPTEPPRCAPTSSAWPRAKPRSSSSSTVNPPAEAISSTSRIATTATNRSRSDATDRRPLTIATSRPSSSRDDLLDVTIDSAGREIEDPRRCSTTSCAASDPRRQRPPVCRGDRRSTTELTCWYHRRHAGDSIQKATPDGSQRPARPPIERLEPTPHSPVVLRTRSHTADQTRSNPIKSEQPPAERS